MASAARILAGGTFGSGPSLADRAKGPRKSRRERLRQAGASGPGDAIVRPLKTKERPVAPMDTSVARKTNVTDFSTAYYLLEGLNEIGIEYLFCNLGTDHAPIIEEMAHRRQRGEAMPKVVRCPHENTAAHMAAGYALVTGRGQGVLVHVDVGTANAANGMHNAYRSRLPMLLMAGRAPYTTHGELVGTRDTHVHFVQEPFDQGSLVRPYTKWEWTLPSGVVVKEALQRAYSVMQSEPRGPVYLMMQRETLTEHWDVDEIRRYAGDRFGPLAGGGADPKLIAQLADRLVAAENPILITGYGGMDALTAQKIVELGEFAGIPVFEANSKDNISYEVRASPALCRTSRFPRSMSGCWWMSKCRGSRPK